jgi:hypothetical protein
MTLSWASVCVCVFFSLSLSGHPAAAVSKQAHCVFHHVELPLTHLSPITFVETTRLYGSVLSSVCVCSLYCTRTSYSHILPVRRFSGQVSIRNYIHNRVFFSFWLTQFYLPFLAPSREAKSSTSLHIGDTLPRLALTAVDGPGPPLSNSRLSEGPGEL